LHRGQVLRLIEDDVTDTADPFDEVNRLVHQHGVRESQPSPGVRGRCRLQQERLLQRDRGCLGSGREEVGLVSSRDECCRIDLRPYRIDPGPNLL
jgi:hypothetical protein